MRAAIDNTLGISNPRLGLRRFTLDRIEPPPDLASVVERFWRVRWDLPEGETFTQEIVPHPCANLSIERTTHDARGANARGLEVHGLAKRRFFAKLEGRGVVLGTKMTPAGLSALAKVPMTSLVGAVLPLEDVVGTGPRLPAIEDMPPGEALARVSDAMVSWLRERLRAQPLDEAIPRVNALVALLREDRSIVRVEDLARHDGSSVRQLQRLFRSTVGIGPKWVVQRVRVQEAAERVVTGVHVDWARTAQELGYHDQAHLIRDFRAQVGFTPEAYARRCRDAEQEPRAAGP